MFSRKTSLETTFMYKIDYLSSADLVVFVHWIDYLTTRLFRFFEIDHNTERLSLSIEFMTFQPDCLRSFSRLPYCQIVSIHWIDYLTARIFLFICSIALLPDCLCQSIDRLTA